MSPAEHEYNKDLVNQILTFSRQKEHKRVLVKAVNLVTEAMELVINFLPSSIKIQMVIDQHCGYIMADPIHINQLMMNLVTNACHAMENEEGATFLIYFPVCRSQGEAWEETRPDLAVYAENPKRFDVVITDLTMPDLSGFDLANKMVEMNPTLPIILCTGLGDSIEKGRDTSVKGFLSKPVEIKALSFTLRRLLDKDGF